MAVVSPVSSGPVISEKYCFIADVQVYHHWLFSLSDHLVVISESWGRRDDLDVSLELSPPQSLNLCTQTTAGLCASHHLEHREVSLMRAKRHTNLRV